MEFDDLLGQVLELLQREERVSYRSIKLRFGIDDDYIEGLKDELLYAKKLAADEDDRVLVWTGDADPTLTASPTSSISKPKPDHNRHQLPVVPDNRNPMLFPHFNFTEQEISIDSSWQFNERQLRIGIP